MGIESPTQDIDPLVQGFAAHIRHLKSNQTKEAEIRQQYLDPFWRALGWDVGNADQLGPTDVEVIIEKTVETAEAGGLRSRRPDYLFRLGGFPRFIVEAKKPAVDIDTDRDAIFQAKQYAWNATIPFAILTDFEQFRLFDTTLQPIHGEPARGLIREFNLDFHQYEAQWDVLRDTFSRDAVAAGSLERLLARVKKLRAGRRVRTVDRTLFDIKGAEPVDRVFLAFLDAHRRHVAAEVYRHNKAAFPDAGTLHGAARLTEAVQRIMDRLVFMRVIEDRGVVAYGTLRQMLERIGAEGGEFYESLTATFREYDQRYNGYLFKPHFSEQLRIDGNVLADFVRTLYPPDGPWDFAAIGDDILGIVYERFLGNVVTVEHQQATIIEKPEVRHAGGVYYTPRFVVDSIIRRVIGPKIKGKTPAEMLEVKILDPACGSGSFLVAALQYLFDACVAAVEADPSVAKAHIGQMSKTSQGKARKKKSEIAFKDAEGRWHLAPDFRSLLLQSCIHGVDIDQQAVEVTVMSLYLKMLESKLPENWATLWVEKQLLPTLDNNIRCGNSLIDEADYYAYREKQGRNQQALFEPESEDTAFRINRFDWASRTRGFGRLLDGQAKEERGRTGFDCIIGNPPYIRVQELNKWAPEECAFYKWRYASAKKGNFDIYVIFTEKALSLLAEHGLLGFIMPHKFWQAQYGAGLREVIADKKHLLAVVDFTHHQVFRGATTYTAIHVLRQLPGSDTIDYARFDELNDGVAQCTALDMNPAAAVNGVTRRIVAQMKPGDAPFSFAATTAAPISGDVKPLYERADLAQGFKTGADKVFVITLVRESDGLATIQSEESGQLYDIEAAALRSLVKSEHMKSYQLLPSPLRLVFPYRREGKTWRLLDPKEIREQFPRLWTNYLLKMKDALDRRENGRFSGDHFYQYSRPQNFEPLSKPKIINPDICEHPQMCFDDAGLTVFSGGAAGGVAIVPNDDIDTFFLLGLLNSAYADRWIRENGTPFRGGYLNCEIRFIRNLPIKLPKTAAEKQLAGEIGASVRAIMAAKTALQNPALSDGEKRRHESTVETHEQRIDQAVFQLYGVDGLP
jgi:type I restriction-modification system DNA methylase subunit